jgi:hypothetical protein
MTTQTAAASLTDTAAADTAMQQPVTCSQAVRHPATSIMPDGNAPAATGTTATGNDFDGEWNDGGDWDGGQDGIESGARRGEKGGDGDTSTGATAVSPRRQRWQQLQQLGQLEQ